MVLLSTEVFSFNTIAITEEVEKNCVEVNHNLTDSLLPNLNTEMLDESSIPEILDLKTAKENGNVKRLYNQENDLNTAVFRNNDGTNQMYLFNENIKYIDSGGNIIDKSNKLAYNDNGYYTNVYNVIKIKLPQTIDSGINLSYINHIITINPISGDNKNSISPVYNKAEKRAQADNIIYNGVFGESTSLRYTPTFSGLKEDIILQKYSGQSEFKFLINTNGLTVVDTSESLYLADPDTGEIVLNISPVEIFDSAYKQTRGSIKVEVLEKNNEYIFTIIADNDFLKSDTTLYPVTIDPFYVFTDGSGSSKTIVDSPLYQNRPNLQAGSSYYNNIGCISSYYGVTRSVTKFPGLMNNVTFNMLRNDRIVSVKYNAYCVVKNNNTNVFVYPFTGSVWDEDTITSGSAGMSYDDSNGVLCASYITSSGRYWDFDITTMAKGWKDNIYDENKGLLLKIYTNYESDPNYLLRFASTEYGSNLPYVTVDYYQSYSFYVDNIYSNRFNNQFSNEYSLMSDAVSFLYSAYYSDFDICFYNSSVSNQTLLTDYCSKGFYGACDSTCG